MRADLESMCEFLRFVRSVISETLSLSQRLDRIEIADEVLVALSDAILGYIKERQYKRN